MRYHESRCATNKGAPAIFIVICYEAKLPETGGRPNQKLVSGKKRTPHRPEEPNGSQKMFHTFNYDI